jgi:hypothetical protein
MRSSRGSLAGFIAASGLGLASFALSLFACGGDGEVVAAPPGPEAGPVATVDPTPPAPPQPSVVSVSIEGNLQRELRQGSGGPPTNAVVTFVARGSNLTGVSAVTVGSGAGSFSGTIDAAGGSATSVRFTVSVPHGAPLGPQPITITTPGGSATFEGAVTISEITVSAGAGNDNSGKGTSTSPFKTFKTAVAFAQSGDTILLKNGTYNAAAGNDWAALTSTTFAEYDGPPNVPAGVRVKGESNTNTMIVGPARTGVSTAFIFGGDGALEDVGIEEFAVGVLVKSGKVSLKNVVVRSIGREGVYVRGGSSAAVSGTTIRTAGSAGLAIFDTSMLTIEQGRITANGKWGVYGTTSGAITMTGVEIDNNWTSGGPANDDLGGIHLNGLHNKTLGALTLKNVNVHDNLRNGIDVRDTTGATTITVTSSQLTKNRFYAIGLGTTDVGGSVTLKLRDTTVALDNDGTDCTGGAGIYQGDRSKVDLGTSAESGGNTINLFGSAGAGAGCRGLTIGAATPTASATTKGTSFLGTDPTTPVAGCSNASEGRKWEIASPGTCGDPPTGNVVVAY